MEDIKAYIESGVLELYVMGDLSPGERRGVEEMVLQYPSLHTELAEIEQAIQGYSQANALTPAENIREKVLGQLIVATPASVIRYMRPPAFYKYGIAALIALLAISWSALFVTYQRLRDSRQTINAMRVSNQQFATRANFAEKALADSRVVMRVLTNPDFKMITLAGTKIAPEAKMKVAFNAKAREVMIDLADMRMPANDTRHQYQLWAIVDGKTVDLGVFDKLTDHVGMLKMKEIDHAQAFAVTLEPRGGSINPTMDQLMVMGNI